MITLKDRLSHLTYRETCKLLGPSGEQLIRLGGKYDIDIAEQVAWENDLFKVNLGDALVTLSLTSEMPKRLRFNCSECTAACEHLGAAFSLILEEKLALGLSAPRPERKPIESLSEKELLKQAIEERSERASAEKIQIQPVNRKELWTDYTVTNYASGKSYRVALRGWERGESYCSCPDFRRNTLGICKHILRVIDDVKNRFSKQVKATPYRPENILVHLRYVGEPELRVSIPHDLEREVMPLVRPLMNQPIRDVKDLLQRVREIEHRGH